MKLHIYLIVLILLTSFIQSTSSQQPAIIIHNHVAGSSSQATTKSGVTFDQKNNFLSIPNAYNNFKNNIPTCYTFLLKHKYKLITGFLFLTFAHTQYKIHRIYKMLEMPTSWCNWKATASVQQLASAPHNELAPELFNAIQKKYLLKSKTTSNPIFLSPFDQFIKDVSQELELLEWYLHIKKFTKITYASKFFYFNHKKSFVQEKINRIHIILDIFITWQTNELFK